MEFLLSEIFDKPISGEWGKELEEGEQGVPVIRTTNFTNIGRLNLKDLVFRNIDIDKYSNKRLNKGDLIIEKSGGSPTQPVGRVVIFDEDNDKTYFFNNFTSGLRPKEMLNSHYALYLMKDLYNKRKVLKYQNKTTGIINLKLNDYISNTKIELPSIDIQERIAEVLDLNQSLIDKKKEQIEKLDLLVKSKFIEMFGDPINNPMKWEVKKMKNISSEIMSGNTPKGGEQVYIDSGIMFLRSQNVWKNKLVLDDVAYIDQATHNKMKKSSLKNKDILMTKTGRINTENSSLGRAAMFLGKDDSANINGHVYLIRLQKQIINEFVLYILTSKEYRGYIRSVCVGGIDKRQLNKEHIEKFPIIYPPVKMQEKFVNYVKQVDKLKFEMEKSLKELEDNFNSLMQKAFKGELFN